jgi:hypothetical protein
VFRVRIFRSCAYSTFPLYSMETSLAERPRVRQSARKPAKIRPGSCGWVYHFAQSGWRAENPGYLKSEAAAYAFELFP